MKIICAYVLINYEFFHVYYIDNSASYVELKGFLEESVVMCGFDHPHVLGLIGICLDPSNSPHLLLPFMENGDLYSYLKHKRDASGCSSKLDQYPQVGRVSLTNYFYLRCVCRKI